MRLSRTSTRIAGRSRSAQTIVVLAALIGSAFFTSPAGAQTAIDRFAPTRLSPTTTGAAQPQSAGSLNPGVAFIASAIVPGAGQYAIGLGRWVPYVAVEAWSWITYFRRYEDFENLQGRYRSLAEEVARRVSTNPSLVGPWPYYEAMEYWSASGAYDVDPRRQGVQPETDRATYNGNQWELARAIHFPSTGAFPPGTPEYERALTYYSQTAIHPDYAWSWGENDLEQQIYRELIRRSDEAHRDGGRALSVVLANHLISAVDALIAARSGDAASRLKLQGGYDPQREAYIVGARIRAH